MSVSLTCTVVPSAFFMLPKVGTAVTVIVKLFVSMKEIASDGAPKPRELPVLSSSAVIEVAEPGGKVLILSALIKTAESKRPSMIS